MFLRSLCALLLILLLFVPTAQPAPIKAVGSPSAQGGQIITVSGTGTEVFRALLNAAGIKPISEVQLRSLTHFDDVILIVLGDANLREPHQPWAFGRLGEAVSSGAVLVATDSPLRITMSNHVAISISGARVECDNQSLSHRNERDCPYVVPIEQKSTKPVHGLFQGLNRIATNSPSFISMEAWGPLHQPLATFPRQCVVGDSRAPLLRTAYFAVGGEESANSDNPSRFLMMSDHSVFINQMLLEPETDNLVLTSRIIQFLQGPNIRTRCVFFEDGRLIDHFDDLGRAAAAQNQLPIPQVNMGAIQEILVTQGNKLLDSVQQEDVMNRALASGFGLPSIVRFFIIVGSIFACWFVLRRTWGTRKPGDIPPAPAVAGAPIGPPGVFERRQKELLRRNNIFEPVQSLVREYFENLGLHGAQGPKHPKLVISDVVRKPDSLRAAIKDFWRIAYGPPQPMTVSRWRELEPFFERVKQAQADGKWRFIVSEVIEGSVA